MFDVDSTLITSEVVEMLAELAGHRAEVARVTEGAMRGELEFADSLRQRVALLAGLPAGALDEVGRALVLTPGAETVLRELQAHGVRCGIASGGFTQVCAYLVRRLGLDFCAANELEVADGRLTGALVGPLVDRAGKAAALKRFAAQGGIELRQTVAVGDGANDIDMVRAAGFSVAFNAKPALAAHASATVNGPSLEPVLALLRAHAPAAR